MNANYLDAKDTIPSGKFKVAESEVIGVNLKKSSGAAVSAIVKGVPVSLKADTAFDQFNTGKLKLVKLSVENNMMKKAANDSPMKLNSGVPDNFAGS